MKQYEIEVYERYSHGVYGKKQYTNLSMILAADTKEQVISFAEDIISQMTYGEVFGEKSHYSPRFIPNGDGTEKAYFPIATDKIGIEVACGSFTIKARVYKG